LPIGPKPALAQQIQLQIEKVQAGIEKQRCNVINAKNAIARSDVEWTKEMGIDDPDLIHSLRLSVKDRLQKYEKGLAGLEKQLVELSGGPPELEKDPPTKEQSKVMDVDFTYDDSFGDIIKAAKAVAHLVCFSAPRNHATLLT
jgi:hypothetical protein